MYRPFSVAAALLLALQAMPACAEAPPKFAEYPVKVFTGKPAKPRFHNQYLRYNTSPYNIAAREQRVKCGRPLYRGRAALRHDLRGADAA